MSNRPTVAHFVRDFLPPTETFVGNQIVTLDRYRPVVFCRHRQPNDTYAVSNVYSVQELLPRWPKLVDRICYGTARYLPIVSAQLVAQQIRREATRLIHFHFLVDARFFLAVKRLTRLPTVVSAYGYDVSSFPRALWGQGRRYLQPIFGEMECFLAMSQDMRRDLIRLGCPDEKIVVHYHGCNTDRFVFPERIYAKDGVVNILMCGSLRPKKGHDRVLQALHMWAQRRSSHQPFVLTLMGDGPQRGKLEALVHEYGWEDRVRFLGHVPHHDPRLVAEYHKADVFTHPSVAIGGNKEGIPGTVVEAMAAGLPVVSTYHAGIPEMITNQEDGLLVNEDDLEGLCEALARLIEEPTLRQRLGQSAARTAATRGRLHSKTPDLERIYDQLLAGEPHC